MRPQASLLKVQGPGAREAGAGGREEAVLAAKFVHPPVSPLIGSLRNNAEA